MAKERRSASARDLKVDGDKMIKKLTRLGESGWRDPDLLQFKVGEDTPARNIIRPVGDFESCRVHYLQDFIGEGDAIPRVPVCPGRSRCPVCQVVSHLYGLGTDAAKEKARSFSSSERNYWNVFPLWEYDWGDGEPRWLVLSFGKEARESLTPVLTEYGIASDPMEGYDLVLEIMKKKGGWGNSYTFLPRVKKARQKGSKTFMEELIVTDIPDDIWNLPPVNLSKYVTPPSEEIIDMLEEKFQMEFVESGGKRRRSEISSEEEPEEEDELEDEDDFDDEEDDMLCFGNPEVYDVNSTACSNCPQKRECRRAVRLKKMESGEKRKSKAPKRTKGKTRKRV